MDVAWVCGVPFSLWMSISRVGLDGRTLDGRDGSHSRGIRGALERDGRQPATT